MSETWVPVEDGNYEKILVYGDVIAINDRNGVAYLPDDLRLCRRVPAPAEPSMADIRIALILAWERIGTSSQSDQTVGAIQRLQSWLSVHGS